ncbi:hypothetical protein [Sporosarcina pasteurii]|uniref:CorA-like Mg2+ transporter protein n=1 Tax=Sporosarcina pasteurii TaxID=1474 RepID=A0A380C8D8_SPOPA|nr:hypothetical protein [Sporosarcina pasteurii]MDS9473003.1 hypothetical protein [Sporosarcina pasteurii]QBQ04513.1 hypothetical protein E2C16_01920 [Sporosarcina pasteurii]SUJ14395.1 Uncharacterised protein [Sporosarcina pasteurii]
MIEKIKATELSIGRTYLSFILPVGFDNGEKLDFARSLEENGFAFFKLNDQNKDHENIFGDEISVDTQELEQYFLPYTEHILFPESLNEHGFHRFTKSIGESFIICIHGKTFPFYVPTIDVMLGPFGFAFLTIRVTLDKEEKDLADVLDFAQHFRAVESKLDEERGAYILHPQSGNSISVYDFLFTLLCPVMERYMLPDEKPDRYFGSFPYIEDERMLVSAFLFSLDNTPITEDQLYRMGTIDGRTPNGEVFISANNPSYVQRFLNKYMHDRWAPHTYTIITGHAFMTISNELPNDTERMLSQFMGTHYYNYLLHYFYKTMLLRVAYEYSKIDWDKDDEYVKSLIKFITLFSSLYYNKDVSTRAEGKELTIMFRKAFQIDSYFKEVTNTLQALYKSQENLAADRMNTLLFILTIFTVISGIYGMNLVIEDWKTHSGWKDFMNYTLFEWISLITAVTGIALSFYLVAATFSKKIRNKLRRRKAKNYL